MEEILEAWCYLGYPIDFQSRVEEVILRLIDSVENMVNLNKGDMHLKVHQYTVFPAR